MKDLIVAICAVVGALLGVFNFAKAWRKDRREAWIGANQNVVKAVRKEDRSDPSCWMHELYLVNSDALPVSDVAAIFFGAGKKPVRHSVSNIGAGVEHRVESGNGKGDYRFAEFTYTDAKGHLHQYKGKVYRP